MVFRLAPNSIHTWFHLEKKFHEHFYTGDNELKLSHLTSVKQNMMNRSPITSSVLETQKTDVTV
jgi:hypothetical protein